MDHKLGMWPLPSLLGWPQAGWLGEGFYLLRAWASPPGQLVRVSEGTAAKVISITSRGARALAIFAIVTVPLPLER